MLIFDRKGEYLDIWFCDGISNLVTIFRPPPHLLWEQDGNIIDDSLEKRLELA